MLKITVYGKELPVQVSDSGVFHVKGLPEHAKTLKGLATKLKSKPSLNPDLPAIRVEHPKTLKQGVVRGRNPAGYRVKWDDGTYSNILSWNLRRPTTVEERSHLAELEMIASNTEIAYNKAQDEYENFGRLLEVTEELGQRYG